MKVKEFIAKSCGSKSHSDRKYKDVIGYQKKSFPPEETEHTLIDVRVRFFPRNDKSYWFISIRLKT